jgi:glycosyltransferase involved in cell wall biosynthesis
MKICFFTEIYYKGGLDTFLINLINTWPDEADELTLVCNSTHMGLCNIMKNTRRPVMIKLYDRVLTKLMAQGQQSQLMWARSLPVRVFFGLIRRCLQYPIIFPWYVLTLTVFFLRSDFDRLMVVNGGYPASLLGRSAIIAWSLAGKRPLAIMNFHSLAVTPPWHFKILENLIDKLVIKFSNQIVGVSKACLNSLQAREAFHNCTKLTYIYNGIEDPIHFLNNDFTKTKSKLTKPYCLMLATYSLYKGHFFLLEAFKSVLKDFPSAQLRIYGYGLAHEKQQVTEEILRLNLRSNVILGDFVLQTNKLFASASVLVVPSQAYESFGLTIIEAMAHSVPVVATDVGGIPEVLRDSCAGYVCSKDSPIEFADAIKNIIGKPTLASELGRNGRMVFESRFKASTMTKQYYNLLKNSTN